MEQNSEYRICTRCIMDTSDPWITFDEQGVCNHCREYDKIVDNYLFVKNDGEKRLQEIADEINRTSKGNKFNCIVGLSGGVDSSYLTYKAVQLGLRPLVVHVDCGWNSEIAVKNIENICKALNLDLFTHVVNWEEMKDLQRSFFLANVANQDIPQDHAIFSGLYHYALKNNIKYVLNGSNFASESVLPRAWGYNALDYRHIRGIQKKFGKIKLKTYPHLTFFRRYIYFSFIRRINIVRVLNYIHYDREEAIKTMEKELGWRYYGGKHHESRFTKFFQAYYLPVKFGYDKRRAHYSSLILAGQENRESALAAMNEKSYKDNEIGEDLDYIAKKLDWTPEEFNAIIHQPNKTYKDYPSNEWIFNLGFKIRKKLFGK
ncbi:MAG: N-acetyl sugar amidotransferase [Bacteroidota bacterium]